MSGSAASQTGSGFHRRLTVTMVPLYDTTNSGRAAAFGGPYPFGIDPAWHGAQNELLFVNSLKMKISVLFGVLQMFMGIVLRYVNAVRERSKLDLLFECCPMTIFLISFFGYMDYMIVYKWTHVLPGNPSIINALIAFAMGGPGGGIFAHCEGFLFLLCLLAVPTMLVPKPLILALQHKQKCREMQSQIECGEPLCRRAVNPDFDFGEIVIHQLIETIEFVLGTVSHTASYLRLWALSLAHQQLSLVFFKYTLLHALEGGASGASSLVSNLQTGVSIYLAFILWFFMTAFVLMGMDVLECFLHCLRLHWVEFQSKFYRADGVRFAPYRHQAVLSSTG